MLVAGAGVGKRLKDDIQARATGEPGEQRLRAREARPRVDVAVLVLEQRQRQALTGADVGLVAQLVRPVRHPRCDPPVGRDHDRLCHQRRGKLRETNYPRRVGPVDAKDVD